MRAVVLGVFVAGLLVGCVNIEALQRQTARALNPPVYPDSIKITEVRRSGTRWVAITSSGVYDCSIEGDEDRPLCVKRQTPP